MKLVIDLTTDALMAKLSGYPERLTRSVAAALDRSTTMIQVRVKQKLSGEVLHVRTGTLRRSINKEVRNAGNGVIEGIVGTNVEYAAIHEYGFKGVISVKAHMRALRKAGKDKLFKTKKSAEFGIWKHVRGRKTGKVAQVHGWFTDRQGQSNYLRHVDMPERSFLRSTLKEMEPKVREELRFAMLEALHK